MTETPSDTRVRPALLALESGAIDVVSFDVFDTILWRTVPEPVDAFVLMGHRLQRDGVLADDVTPGAFARLRQRAETRARKERTRRDEIPEVTLPEIYAELPAWIFAGRDHRDAMDVEVDVEHELTVVDLEIAALAALAHDKYGARLVCVSDTYFSEDQIRRFVQRGPLRDVPFTRVFVSNDYRAGKTTGIWSHVLGELEVVPAHVLHIGDNEDADVSAPSELGIRTVHHEQRPATLQTILQREGVVGQGEPLDVKPSLHAEGGDFGLTALRSKMASLGDDTTDNAFWRFGASVLGPVLTGFAEWVVEQAEAEGTRTVYCVMREGEFLSRLVDGAAIAAGSPVRAERLWLSRHVCSRAALVDGSEDELRSFLTRRAAPTVATLVEGLGLEIGQFPELAGVAQARMDDPLTRDRVIWILTHDDDVRAQVVAQAAALRSRLASYVAGVTKGADSVVLVDLGWAGTIQERLDHALQAAGGGPSTLGLYLLTNDGALDRTIDGVHARGYLAEYGLPSKVSRWVIRSPEILEQVCMCDEGSMVDIDAGGRPVHGPSVRHGAQSLQRVSLQQGVLAFQRERSRYREQLAPPARRLSEARPLLRDIVTRFVVRPTEEEAAVFGAWLHDENFGSSAQEPIVRADVGPTMAYMSPRQLLEYPMTALYWPFGAATTYNPPLALAAAALVDGTLPDEAFVAGEAVDVRLLVDAGAWGDAGGTWVTPNAAGRFLFHRTIPEQHRIRQIGFRFGHRPGVLRLDWVKFVFVRRDGEPVTVHLDTPAALGQLHYREGIPIAPNAIVAPRRAPEAIFRCPRQWSESAHGGEVEVAFAWLPTGPVEGAPPTNAEAAIHLARRAAGKARNVWHNAHQEAYGRLRRR